MAELAVRILKFEKEKLIINVINISIGLINLGAFITMCILST